MWCLVFLFITRERREREFHTTRLPEDKKDEECIENVSHCDESNTLFFSVFVRI